MATMWKFASLAQEQHRADGAEYGNKIMAENGGVGAHRRHSQVPEQVGEDRREHRRIEDERDVAEAEGEILAVGQFP